MSSCTLTALFLKNHWTVFDFMNIYTTVCLFVFLIHHLSKDISVAPIFLEIMNKASINIHVQVLYIHKVLVHLVKYLGAQLLYYMVRIFRFVRTVFQSGCTILQSSQQWMIVFAYSTTSPAFCVVSILYFGNFS